MPTIRQREFVFVFWNNPNRKSISIFADGIDDAIEQTHNMPGFPNGHVQDVSNRPGKSTIVTLQIDRCIGGED